jgi:hypothetical protein
MSKGRAELINKLQAARLWGRLCLAARTAKLFCPPVNVSNLSQTPKSDSKTWFRRSMKLLAKRLPRMLLAFVPPFHQALLANQFTVKVQTSPAMAPNAAEPALPPAIRRSIPAVPLLWAAVSTQPIPSTPARPVEFKSALARPWDKSWLAARQVTKLG